MFKDETEQHNNLEFEAKVFAEGVWQQTENSLGAHIIKINELLIDEYSPEDKIPFDFRNGYVDFSDKYVKAGNAFVECHSTNSSVNDEYRKPVTHFPRRLFQIMSIGKAIKF